LHYRLPERFGLLGEGDLRLFRKSSDSPSAIDCCRVELDTEQD
jgi:hypothetical protein